MNAIPSGDVPGYATSLLKQQIYMKRCQSILITKEQRGEEDMHTFFGKLFLIIISKTNAYLLVKWLVMTDRGFYALRFSSNIKNKERIDDDTSL